MIDKVVKVLDGYNGLDTQGKRLFRDELGLVRPQQATKRRRRAAKRDIDPTKLTQAAPKRRGRKPKGEVNGNVVEPGTGD